MEEYMEDIFNATSTTETAAFDTAAATATTATTAAVSLAATAAGALNNTCLNEEEWPIDMRFNSGNKLSIIVYSILMVISSIGNITVLVLLIKRRLRSASRIDIMLTHLAIADLLVTFLMMPLEIGWAATVSWRAGNLMCRVMAFFRTFGLYLSSFILVCISVDRYFAVLKPLHVSVNRGKIMIIIAWFFSCLCSAPQAYIFHVEAHPNITCYEQCVTYNIFKHESYQVIYSVLCMIFMYSLPLLIVIFSYASIYIEIFKRSRITNSDKFRRSSVEILSRAKRRTLKMTITIVLIFVICWTPYYFMCLWYWIDPYNAKKVDQIVQKGLFLFACTNSCMNPIVYGIYNIRRRGTDRRANSTICNESMIGVRCRDSTRTICISCGDTIELKKNTNGNGRSVKINSTAFHC